MNKVILFFIIFLITTGNIAFANAPAIKTGMLEKSETQYVPDTAFFDKNNNKLYLDQYEGKVILIVFWATWCESCVHEMPSLDILQKDFRKFPFEVIALSQDFQGIDAVEEFFKNYNIRHLKPYHDYNNKIFKELSIAGLPSALLVDVDGKIRVKFKGRIKWHDEQIRQQILSYIPNNPVYPKNTYKESFNIKNPNIKSNHEKSDTQDNTNNSNLNDNNQEINNEQKQQ